MPIISILCYSAYQFFVRSYNTLKTKQINVNFFIFARFTILICEVYNTILYIYLRGLQYFLREIFCFFAYLYYLCNEIKNQ